MFVMKNRANVCAVQHLMANTVTDVKMAILAIQIANVRKLTNHKMFWINGNLFANDFLFLPLDCNCDLQGTEIDVCNKDNGTCLCREGYETPRCDQCLPGYYGYPECVKCNCSTVGSNSFICDATGKCPCLTNFAGKQCTLCSAGYYDYPQCLCKLPCLYINKFFR